jgi:DNA polymerase IIIc chi subunit
MTSIDFYTHVDDRLEVAAKLVAKAFAQHGSVRVLTPDAATTEELGRRLWLKPPIAFLPHCRVESAELVNRGHRQCQRKLWGGRRHRSGK